MNSEHRDKSASQHEEGHARGVAAGEARLALIKKRVEKGYYNSETVIQEVVEAMMESIDRRAIM